MDPDAKNLLRIASRYSYVGIFFGVAICIGYFSGRWLDARFHTDPWFSIIGLVIGIGSGFRELLRLARRGLKEEQGDTDASDAGPPPPPTP